METIAMKLTAHDAANIVPSMTADEFRELKKDIKERGLIEPIVLFDGKILDGRNRYKACAELGIAPETLTLDEHDIGGDPAAYVLSTNLHRRHLTPSQRAMIATDLEKFYAKAAKERQRLSEGPGKKGLAPVPNLNEIKVHAAEQAGKAVGVGARSVTAAKTVINRGCDELQTAVRDGRVAVKVAEKFARAISPAVQSALVYAALLEDDPNKALSQSSKPRPVQSAVKIPAALITGTLKAIEELEQRLERCGVLSTVRNHLNAIREAVENVKH
jgi:ParB-like chromosome segregation protein Spo0J